MKSGVDGQEKDTFLLFADDNFRAQTTNVLCNEHVLLKNKISTYCYMKGLQFPKRLCNADKGWVVNQMSMFVFEEF